MHNHASELSPPCRGLVENATAAVEAFSAACGADLASACPAPPGASELSESEMRSCAIAHLPQLSPGCLAAVSAMLRHEDARLGLAGQSAPAPAGQEPGRTPAPGQTAVPESTTTGEKVVMQTSAAAAPAGGERLAEAPPAPGAGPAGTEPLRSWAEGLIEMFAGPLDLEKPEVQVAVVAEGAGSEDREMEEEREQVLRHKRRRRRFFRLRVFLLSLTLARARALFLPALILGHEGCL